MPRIIVTTDPNERRDSPVLLDERVYSLHLCDDHAAEQLIERLAWAVSDAEDLSVRCCADDDPAMGGSRETWAAQGSSCEPPPCPAGALAPPPHRKALHGRRHGAHARAHLQVLVLLGCRRALRVGQAVHARALGGLLPTLDAS